MDNSERLITAFYYSVGGVILGLGLAIFSSLYLGSTVSSPKIIIFTVISCFVIGEPYRVCRRLSILRECSDDQIKIYP